MKAIGLTQRVEYFKDSNECRDCLDQAWAQILTKMDFLPVPLSNGIEDVDTAVSQLNLCGVILTGGNDLSHIPGGTNTAPQRDTFEEKLIKVCTRRTLPVLGVCRGLQMLVHFYRGELTPVTGHVGGEHPLKIRQRDFMPLGNLQKVNSYHQFGLTEDNTPKDLIVVATAEDETVEAVVHRDLLQWGIMWHPEREPYNQNNVTLMKIFFNGLNS